MSVQGQGFSTTPASNNVSFNGAEATVVSGNPNQLLVTVPGGATTGPLSITTAGPTASTETPFTVDGTGLPPTLTSVAPLGGGQGVTVTLTGTHLSPVAGGTSVTLNGTPATLTTATDTPR